MNVHTDVKGLSLTPLVAEDGCHGEGGGAVATASPSPEGAPHTAPRRLPPHTLRFEGGARPLLLAPHSLP